ncbi:MAG: M48 family metallopeptidase [Acidobacteria bacterium]|nr:M48 family metallopeptidase [Acidobacteriota bacterium]
MTFVRHRRARRYIIRVLADGTVRVTLPRCGTRREATAFLQRSHPWIAREQAKRRASGLACRAWREGSLVLVDGELHAVSIRGAPPDLIVHVGDTLVARGVDVDATDARPTVERWLRSRAVSELGPRLLALARAHAVTVTRVSVRDQHSRWGACSPRGAITLNWRLVQVPPFVREYVLLHELMHCRELNHSRRFWRHMAEVCPRFRDARAWLLTRGRELL